MSLSVALYQPDIAGNTGTILRSSACLDFSVEIIEPAGFDASDRALKRAGMDYLAMSRLTRHVDFDAFNTWRQQESRRLVLFTTQADAPFWDVRFEPGDILLFGRESAGVPPAVHDLADMRVTIPMASGARSLNLAVAVALGVGEATRQLRSAGDRGRGAKD